MTPINLPTIEADDTRYWALVVAGQGGVGAVVQPLETLEKLLLLLLTEGVWPHSAEGGVNLAQGDEVVFALVTRDGPKVYGTAVVGSASAPIDSGQFEVARMLLGAAMPVDPRAATHVVGFDDFSIWDAPWLPPSVNDPTLDDLVAALDGAYTTGVVRPLDPPVFGRFVGRDLAPAALTPPSVVSGPSAAPASAVAEPPAPRVEPAEPPSGAVAPPPAEPRSPAVPEMTGLLVQNWDVVDFGEPLALLNGAVHGERTETPEGPIDALCEATRSGDMVAMIWADGVNPISLAESVPRRLTWLRRFRARPGQRVRALLITLQGGLDHVVADRDDIEFRRLRIACTAPEDPRPEPLPEPAPRPVRPLPRLGPSTEEEEVDFARRCMAAVRHER